MLESDNLESQLEIVMTLFAHLGGIRWAGSESGMVCPAIFSWKCVKIEKDQLSCFEQSLEPDHAQNPKIQKKMHFSYLYKMLRKGKLFVVQQPVSVSVCKPEQSNDGNLIWRILSHCSFIWQFRFCKQYISICNVNLFQCSLPTSRSCPRCCWSAWTWATRLLPPCLDIRVT